MGEKEKGARRWKGDRKRKEERRCKCRIGEEGIRGGRKEGERRGRGRSPRLLLHGNLVQGLGVFLHLS